MDFQSMLQRGLGRAVLFLQNRHDAKQYREDILHACSHFVGYDAQMEPSRAQYLYDIIQATGEATWYASRLSQMVSVSDTDIEDWWQVYDVMALFARDGDAVMRASLYEAVRNSFTTQSGYDAASALIVADGLSALLFLADQMAKTPLTEDDIWMERAWINDYKEQVGDDEARQALDEAASSHPSLSVLLLRVADDEAETKAKRRSRPSRVVPPYDEIRRQIASREGKSYLARWWNWGKGADNATLLRLANDLLHETDHERLTRYLLLFRHRRFPLEIDRLLAVAQNTEWQTTWAACEALTHFSDPRVRTLALEMIASSSNLAAGVDLLRNNFQEDDYVILQELPSRITSRDEFHRFGISVRELVDVHTSADAIPLLLQLYEGGHCAMCRHAVVVLLQSLGSLPDWLAQECRFDSYGETRDLVKTHDLE